MKIIPKQIKKKKKRTKLAKALLFTGFYFLATTIVVVLLNTHQMTVDTDNLVAHAYTISDVLEKTPNTHFDETIKILPLTHQNKAIKNIENGATFSRTLSQNTLKVTIPNYKKAILQNYIQVTAKRSSTLFETILIIIFTIGIYLIWAVQFIIRTQNQRHFETDTIAKIKNIRRSPLTQSYLISENDNKITTELNLLGDFIQNQAQSQTPTKQNLYEFIDYFEFPIFIYDLKGTIRSTNASFKNEFSDTKTLDIFSPYSDVLQFLVNKMLQPTRQERTFHFEKLNAYYVVDVLPLSTLNSLLMVTMIDVTAYKATLRAHNDFIANISHDFKTPLTAISGFADILAHDNGQLTPKKRQGFAQHIAKESKRLTNLVADTLEITRQTTNIKKTKVNLTQMTQDILKNYELAISKKSLQISTHLENVTIKSNEKHLYAILKNLIENAINYTPNTGHIIISIAKTTDKITFTVSDNGPGLSEIEKTRIFERFYRSDTSRNSDGTGLGLTIVKKNLAELGGTIEVQSVMGKGTTFTVRF
ncbi:two-component sensor histidine kinase [Lactococcus hodotermopsidis]|uniref:histidine kinase n=1 Tax=Pseudolactococcus hodotermopsidis TaxID=2709157 RepID=A0A6A0B978_9LACT|nr:ATP-binding protein [Lactococcus hodotermopsidis]GFH41979.1 two-component sensor histidine kinase [Lactococcus hodotermopsidis]